MYELTEFNNGLKGYKISWKELEIILDTIVPARTLVDGTKTGIVITGKRK